MSSKKYRVCLAFFVVLMLMGSIFYYSWYTKNKETPVDGMLVENCEIMEVEEAA